MLRLIVQNDHGRKAELPLQSPEITIGRGEDNTVQLDDRNVSRRHARLRQIENSYVLEDLGSSNGIWMNGKRVVGNISVKDGDSFRLGDYEVVVEDDSAHPTPPQTAGGNNGAGTVEVTTEDLFPSDLRDSPTEEMNFQALSTEPGPLWVDLENSTTRLILTSTPSNGREFPLVKTVVRIGSAAGNDVQIDDPSVSGHHARLERDKTGDWHIYDWDSAGLAVNGTRRANARLKSGDQILLGKVTLTFVGPKEAGPLLQLGEVMSRRGQRLKAIVFLALVASFAGLGGGILVLFWLKNQLVTNLPPIAVRPAAQAPREEIRTTPAAKDNPADVRADVRRAEEAAPPKTTRSEPAPAPDAPAARYEPKLYAAKAAMARKDFRRVVDLLAPVQSADGSRPADAEVLIREATTELRAQKSLSLAQKNLQSGRLEDAGRFLKEASDTKAYVSEYRQLKARADTAMRQAKRSRNKDSLEGRPLTPARVALARVEEAQVPEDIPPPSEAKTTEAAKTTEPVKTPEIETPPAPEPAIASPPPAAPPPLTAAELSAITALERRLPPREERAVAADPSAWIVVAHPSVRASLSRAELRQIFSGDSVPSEGGRIMQIVLGPLGSPARHRFVVEGLGRSEAQLKAAWTRLVFRGGGVRPPLEMSDDASVVSAVAGRPGAIGVVREGTELNGVVRVTVR